jgi:hypothetical protein
MGLGSEIRDPEKNYPGSRFQGQKGTGFRIQIRNTGTHITCQLFFPETGAFLSLAVSALSFSALASSPPQLASCCYNEQVSESASFDLTVKVVLPTVLRIRDAYPGSQIQIFSNPDPRTKRFPDSGFGSAFASKNLSIKYLSSRKYDPKRSYWSGS